MDAAVRDAHRFLAAAFLEAVGQVVREIAQKNSRTGVGPRCDHSGRCGRDQPRGRPSKMAALGPTPPTWRGSKRNWLFGNWRDRCSTPRMSAH